MSGRPLGLGLLLSRGFSVAPSWGDWLLLGTVPMIGFCDAWSKRVLEDVDPLTLSAGRQLFGLALVGLYASIATGLGPGESWGLSAEAGPWMIGAGVLAGAFAYGFYLGVDRVGVTLAAGLVALAPAMTAFGEWAILGSPLGLTQLAGIALIVMGVVCVAARPE